MVGLLLVGSWSCSWVVVLFRWANRFFRYVHRFGVVFRQAVCGVYFLRPIRGDRRIVPGAFRVVGSSFFLVGTCAAHDRRVGCLIRYTCSAQRNCRRIQFLRRGVFPITRVREVRYRIGRVTSSSILLRLYKGGSRGRYPILFHASYRNFRRSNVKAAMGRPLAVLPRPYTRFPNFLRGCEFCHV